MQDTQAADPAGPSMQEDLSQSQGRRPMPVLERMRVQNTEAGL